MIGYYRGPRGAGAGTRQSSARQRIAYLRHATRWTCAIPIIICFNLGGHGARRPGVAGSSHELTSMRWSWSWSFR